ncbi:hypothetical protein J2T57_001233 [Natronocella acetinitrilica]|uniref:Uncharacterized protein n=1 Tax=Natronocella acetinitrilica TaxID=414046 RepID=A0AAE3G1S6_9GAMM|nr:hypothetical protein [Natronocella acetinitrilica]MCP1674131.1 hypothetical protein [Natronocella acetinitrilica]
MPLATRPHTARPPATAARLALRHARQLSALSGRGFAGLPRGWHGLSDRLLCATEAAGGARFTRLDAAYGCLRVAFEAGERDLVGALVTAAQAEAAVTCERCGGAGLHRRLARRAAVLCMPHFVHLALTESLPPWAVRTWLRAPLASGAPAVSRAAALGSDRAPQVLEQALARLLPPAPRIEALRADAPRIAGVCAHLRRAFGARLHGLRLLPGSGPAERHLGLVLELSPGEAEWDAMIAVEALPLDFDWSCRIECLSPQALAWPGRSADPWLALLARDRGLPVARLLAACGLHGPAATAGPSGAPRAAGGDPGAPAG